jgi:isoleucyl-tRNA synthetase
VWTTTPWTLPSNLAIMVDPDMDYVVVESDITGRTERYVIADALLDNYAAELGDRSQARIVERLKGSQLMGRSYTPPFDYYRGHRNAHRVVPAAEFVTAGEGTGLVHSAGAFGEEDKIVTDRNDIAPVVPVAADGTFTEPVDDYAGVHVFDANGLIIDHLEARTSGIGDPAAVTEGTVLLRQEMYDHSYPHCWRCRNPLIYMGVSSWFVEVTRFRDRMVELNQQITWVPGHVKDGQFGNWLAGARDWSISRNRFWGSPIPVWKSDDPAHPRIDVYGSLDELEKDFGVRPDDLHRPGIDQLVRPNPDDPTGQSVMRRIPDVLDVWFDSGSMPYGQVHYPFENADWFEHHYPGDFIVEYIGQTRGWFYTMHVLATALFDRPAFRNCLCHGIVLGSDGQKMSKSLNNYPDVSEVFDRDGADAMRWFLMSSPILRGGNLVVTENAIREGVRQVIIPLWNTWYFFSLYAEAANAGAGYNASWSTESDDVLDRYILAKLRQSVTKIGNDLQAMNIAGACDEVRWFIEGLSNWYVRRSRDRFWDGESAESRQAFDTLYTVLETICRAAAPPLPMITEEVWRGLTGQRSVHLTDWPDADRLPADDDLVARMDRVREVCTATSALRKANGLRVRLPLGELQVAADDAKTLEPFTGLIQDELNVQSLDLVDLAAAGRELGVREELQVNARAAGPRLGRDVQTAIQASKAGDWQTGRDDTVISGGITLTAGEYTLATVLESGGDDHQAVATLPSGGYVILNTDVTPELAAEGVARDVVRAVQQARRSAGLEISDRIRLDLSADDAVRGAVEKHRDLIAGETLAETVDIATGPGEQPTDLGDGRQVSIAVAKI